MYDILQLNDMLVPELKDLAEKLGLRNTKRFSKQELIYKILDQQALLVKKEAAAAQVAAPVQEVEEKEVKKRGRKPASSIMIKEHAEVMDDDDTPQPIEVVENLPAEAETNNNSPAKRSRTRIVKGPEKVGYTPKEVVTPEENETSTPSEKTSETLHQEVIQEKPAQIEQRPKPNHSRSTSAPGTCPSPRTPEPPRT